MGEHSSPDRRRPMSVEALHRIGLALEILAILTVIGAGIAWALIGGHAGAIVGLVLFVAAIVKAWVAIVLRSK
jgi:hypothetical protein